MARKGYRKNVHLTLELTEYFRTHLLRPISTYIAEKGITDIMEIDNICRVARICGRNVVKKKGTWYEDGQSL